MNIFNSIGSNYNLKIATNTLTSIGSKKSRKDLIDYLNTKYKGQTYLFYKGRQAIEACLKLLNLEPDSCVVINGFTCKVVDVAVRNANLKSVCLDPDPDTLNFTASYLKNVLKQNKNIKVVIVQHTLGIKAEINEIADICKENKTLLIEDLAHTTEEGKYADFVTLTFSQDKIIDSVSGGALVIRNKKYQNIFSTTLENMSFSQQLKDRFYPILTLIIRNTYKFKIGKYLHYIFKKTKILSDPIGSQKNLGILPNWYCKVALQYLLDLDKDIIRRKKIVSTYQDRLDKKFQFKGSPLIRFPIKLNNRDQVIQILKDNKVYVSDVWYDKPVVVGEISKNILNLPTHKNVTKMNASKIAELINYYAKI